MRRKDNLALSGTFSYTLYNLLYQVYKGTFVMLAEF